MADANFVEEFSEVSKGEMAFMGLGLPSHLSNAEMEEFYASFNRRDFSRSVAGALDGLDDTDYRDFCCEAHRFNFDLTRYREMDPQIDHREVPGLVSALGEIPDYHEIRKNVITPYPYFMVEVVECCCRIYWCFNWRWRSSR